MEQSCCRHALAFSNPFGTHARWAPDDNIIAAEQQLGWMGTTDEACGAGKDECHATSVHLSPAGRTCEHSQMD